MGRGAAEAAQIARSSDVTHRPFGAAKQIRRPGAPPPELSARGSPTGGQLGESVSIKPTSRGLSTSKLTSRIKAVEPLAARLRSSPATAVALRRVAG